MYFHTDFFGSPNSLLQHYIYDRLALVPVQGTGLVWISFFFPCRHKQLLIELIDINRETIKLSGWVLKYKSVYHLQWYDIIPQNTEEWRATCIHDNIYRVQIIYLYPSPKLILHKRCSKTSSITTILGLPLFLKGCSIYLLEK